MSNPFHLSELQRTSKDLDACQQVGEKSAKIKTSSAVANPPTYGNKSVVVYEISVKND